MQGCSPTGHQAALGDIGGFFQVESPWFEEKESAEQSSLTSEYRALLLGWLPGSPFRAEKLLCAAQPQLCSSSAKSHQTGAGLVASVL